MADWNDALSSTFIGQMLRGLLKLALAGVVSGLLASINIDLSHVSLGGSTINLSIIWIVIKVFAPLLLVLSGLRDLGVKL